MLFATKLRTARAILGWSQSRFAEEAGITQRAIHKLESAAVEPRRTTALAIEDVWRRHDICFEETPEGAFRVAAPVETVRSSFGKEKPDADRLRVVAGWTFSR